ncbi:MAG: hypothetical protein M1561_04970 [Gammaproteobacteria bacterium]|nr:hypothetical protein [Gammaproteobacteria bacterium]
MLFKQTLLKKKPYIKALNLTFLLLFIMGFYQITFANNTQVNLRPEVFMTYYYLNPQSSKLIPSLQYDLQYSRAMRPDQINILIHFHAAAINHSKNKDELIQQLQQLRKQYSGVNLKIINRVIAEAKNFTSPTATSGDNFDLLWAEFFATGDPNPVKKIANYLQLSDYKDRLKVVFLASAEWSLASNTHQHKKVAEILQDLYKTSAGNIKRRLQRILNDPRGVTVRLDSTWHQLEGHELSWQEFKEIVW